MRIIQALLIAHGYSKEHVLHPELVLQSRNARIRDTLLEGPCTTDEVAVLLGIDYESAHAGLWALIEQDHVERLRRVQFTDGHHRTLYGLTEHGIALTKRHTQVRSIGEPKAAAGPPPHDGGSPHNGNASVRHNPPGSANAVHAEGIQAPAQTKSESATVC